MDKGACNEILRAEWSFTARRCACLLSFFSWKNVFQFITPDLFLDSHVTAFFSFFHWLQVFTPPAFFVIQQKSLPYTAIRPLG